MGKVPIVARDFARVPDEAPALIQGPMDHAGHIRVCSGIVVTVPIRGEGHPTRDFPEWAARISSHSQKFSLLRRWLSAPDRLV
jgi:hypothetical protein